MENANCCTVGKGVAAARILHVTSVHCRLHRQATQPRAAVLGAVVPPQTRKRDNRQVKLSKGRGASSLEAYEITCSTVLADLLTEQKHMRKTKMQ